MRKYFMVAFVATTFLAANVSAQVSLPAASTTETIRQDFGLGRIELVYSRPNIKGRSYFKENSDLAPLGKIWRTGANSSTKLKFSDKVIVGGKSLDTGTYVLYTVPNKNDWDIIINKGVNNWGSDGYKESEDVVRFKVPANKMKDEVETFTMQFANIANESCELHLMWGNTVVKIPITTNIRDRIRTQVENALKGEKKPYTQAATFYFEWDKDYAKALDNVNKAIEASPKSPSLYLLKGKIQNAMGDKQAAKASANKCIELATAAKVDEYVNQANYFLKHM
jgi:tetratricopeptide (TPR) repeat protein